jgi:hypothetical protein
MLDAKQLQKKTQSVYFGSLKSIWLSHIPVHERQEKFPDALEQIPSKLVTTSTFCNIFFPDLSNGQKGSLDGERAWFGIRSILKGGVLAIRHDGNYTKDDLAQLGNTETAQIPAKHTSEHFSDEELKSLLIIYEEYQKWLMQKGFYDDIDLVIRAVRNESGEEARNQKEKDDLFNLSLTTKADKRKNMINNIRLNDDRVVFKKPAQKELKKIEKQNDNRRLIYDWIHRNILNHRPFTQTHVEQIKNRNVGSTEIGVPIYKSNITKGGRVYWSSIKKGKTSTIVIYDFCTSKEEKDPRLSKILKNYKYLEAHEKDDESSKAITVDFTIDDTPCEGPVRPWPHSVEIGFGLTEKINRDSNIQLDELQRGAILSNQPLLIDGLAGTGKTSVLSYRAVVRCATSSPKTSILVTASKDHVVQRISDTMLEIKENGDWKGMEFEMQYKLGPGISNDKTPTMDLAKFSQEAPSKGFDEIVLDESQDITSIEFEMLKRLLIGHNLRRLVFAGDPLQTLNPTGFDWNRIQAMFIDGGVEKSDINIEKFYNNYRSQKKIVEFANAIQLKRGELFGDKSRTVMKAIRGGTEKIRFIRYNLEIDNHMQAIGDIIRNAGESKAVVITSAPDDTGIKDLLSGNNAVDTNDPVMQHVWQKKNHDSDEELDASNFRKELYLHSSSSVKGAEYDVVVLYRFASSKSARESLLSLLQEWSSMGKVAKEQGIKIRYEYSKLYVALTRAFSRIYLIEDTEGYDFWKNVKLYENGAKPENGVQLKGIGTFIDFEDYLDPLKAVDSEDLKPKIEANRENYNEERDKFLKDPTNIIALQYAIGLGKRLLQKEKDSDIQKQLYDLQGEYAWYQSREPGRSDKERNRLLEDALEFFTKAGSYDKAGPIYYSSKKYDKCLTNVQNMTGSFYKFITLLCKIHLKRDTNLSLSDCLDLLDYSIQPNQTWAKIYPMDEGRITLKDWILGNYTANEVVQNEKSKPQYDVAELIANYPSSKDIMLILEVQKQTKTLRWNELYAENVIKYIKSLDTTKDQNGEYYEKLQHLSNASKEGKVVKNLRRSIDRGLLEELPKHKNPSTNLKRVFDDLEKEERKSPKDKDPMEIENLQTKGLFLARRISASDNDLGIFDVILEASGTKEKSAMIFETSKAERMLKIMQAGPATHKFPTQANLAWLNKSNYATVIDSYLQKLFESSIDEKYHNKDPSVVWKEQISTKANKKIGKGATNESMKMKKEFKEWFETFYKYTFQTRFSANLESNLIRLFSWTDFSGFDQQDEGKSCFITLMDNRSTPPKIYDCERQFIDTYIKAESTEIKQSNWKKILKWNDETLSRTVMKARWERENSRFMLQFNDKDAKKINQQTLSKYLKVLGENGFVDEMIKAEEQITITEKQVFETLKAKWEEGDLPDYFKNRQEYTDKGMTELPHVPEMNLDTYFDNEDWFKEHGLCFCSEEILTLAPRVPSSNIDLELFGFLYSKNFNTWVDKGLIDSTAPEIYDEKEQLDEILDDLYRSFTPAPSAKHRKLFASDDCAKAQFIAFLIVFDIMEIPDQSSWDICNKYIQMYKQKRDFFNEKSLKEVQERINKFK